MTLDDVKMATFPVGVLVNLVSGRRYVCSSSPRHSEPAAWK